MSKMQSVPDIAGIIKKRRQKLEIREGYISLIWRALLIAVIGYVVFTQVIIVTQANGIGMFPAIKDGDLIISFRLQQAYTKNDVVTYKVDGIRYIGRIAAREKDVVTMDDSGTLLVNGTVQGGEIFYPTYPGDTIQYPYTVPVNHCFILGDYRIHTKDSRDFGPVPMESVEGKVITIIRRRGI